MSEASCIYLFKALSLSYFEYRRFKCQLFTGNGMFVCVDDQAVLYTTVSFTTHVKLTEFDFSIPSNL